MEPKKELTVEELTKQRDLLEKLAQSNYKEYKCREKILKTLIALELITEDQLEDVKRLVDSTSFFKD